MNESEQENFLLINRPEALKRSHERRDGEVYIEILIGSRAD